MKILQNTNFNESNPLSRFFQAFDGKDYVFAVISASRSGMTKEEDKQKNKELRDDIRRNSFGYKEVCGTWKDDNTGETVYDDSNIILTDSKHAYMLFEFCVDWCKKYNQDAFMFKDGANYIVFYDSEGKVKRNYAPITKFNPYKISDYMTIFKTQKYRWDYKKDTFGNYITYKGGKKIPEKVILSDFKFNLSEKYHLRRSFSQFSYMASVNNTPKYLRECMDVEYEDIDD